MIYIINSSVGRRMIKFAEIVGGSEEKSNPACEVIAIGRQKVVSE